MRTECRWNDTEKGKPTYSEKNLSQCHLVYFKFHMDRQYIETYVLLWDVDE